MADDEDPFEFFKRASAPVSDSRVPLLRRWWLAGRTLVALLALVTVLVAGAAWFVRSSADQDIATRRIQALPAGDSLSATTGSTDREFMPERLGDRRPAENVLILGLDTRGAEQDEPALSTSQSDVIMILHISEGGDRVDMLSIPRDLLIPAPSCKAWNYAEDRLSDQTFANGTSQWKITNAHAVGGPACSVTAVEELTGIGIDRLIVMDFAGFKDIVDGIGGISVDFAGPVIDDGTPIVSSAGVQTINGEQALALVRARHVQGDGTGDLGRIGRQQQVIAALLLQALSDRMLLQPMAMNAGLQSFIDNTKTDNMTFDDLVGIVEAVKGTGSKLVGLHTLPTRPSTGSEGLVQVPGTDVIFESFIKDLPYPAPEPGW